MTFTSHFDGAALPAEWSFSSALGDGSVSVANSRAIISIPASAHDTIYNTSVADNAVGIAAAVPAHGGDIDVAFQIDTDFTDLNGSGVNLLALNAAGDGVRFSIYKKNVADDEYPWIYAYSRAGGTGASPVNTTYDRYMTGCPSFLRIKYTAATGVWEFLTSSDGYTWVGDWSRKTATGNLTITRAFTADTIKFGLINTGSPIAAYSVAVQRVVDLIAAGTTDLREAPPTMTATTLATIDGTAGALAAPWTNDCAGTDTLTWTGTALRLNHDATQNADTTLARAAVGYSGTTATDWGILLKVANPIGDTDCYLTVGGSATSTKRDQYHIGPGYGLEIQSGLIRRPIRMDDNADATNNPAAPYPTGLNETPYFHMKSWENEYDMRLGGVRWFRIERLGSRYRVKEWADGSAEPSTWNLFDGQDQVLEGPVSPYVSVSHNNTRTGTVAIDIYSMEFYSLAAPSLGNMLEVVSDAAKADLTTDASGQAWYDHFTGLGYNVTLAGVSDIPTVDPSLYDVIWVGNSVPQTTSLGPIVTTTTPVLATGVRSPHPNYSSATRTDGAASATIYLKAAGVGAPMIDPAWVEGTYTVLDAAFTSRYVLNTKYGSGVHQVACDAAATLTHISWSYYNAGDAMATGTAPSKRAWFLFHPGSIGANANGWDVMERLVAWAVTNSPPPLITECWLFDGSSLDTSIKLNPLLWDGTTLQPVDFYGVA